MATFTGVLAVLHTPTPDGRRLGEPNPALARTTPLPLVRPGEPGIGRIDRVWRDGKLIRYSGQLDDSHPGAQEIRAEIKAGRLVGMLDLDGGMASGVAVRGWRVTAATLMQSEGKVWPEVSLTLDEET